ncbi:hypothetical protein J2S43_002153 [Catenuloplanes nepalensis]|uniref:AraC family transcriptional regulator n=1 Tax=Catenuloplanes nepalensis TaxID=587533 RepID=A0ABT9MRI9_9ACTN|nr:hypothetical protein [Catenuloplanes nepalensis]MDP9793641.1 hypothetical protein [Catenuloplanes nepalensis]
MTTAPQDRINAYWTHRAPSYDEYVRRPVAPDHEHQLQYLVTGRV